VSVAVRLFVGMSALTALSSLAVTAGCRPDPQADSTYDQQETFDAGVPLPGPIPYQPGSARLDVGSFYEGQSSQRIPIDATHHVYIYAADDSNPAATLTAALIPDPDRIEGIWSTRVGLTMQPWWGFGVHWDSAVDFAAWKFLRVSLKSSDAAFADVAVAMNSAAGSTPMTVKLDAGAYGYKNDGAWHTLAIPIADFAAGGLDVSQVIAPFVLTGGAGPPSAILKVDDLYFTAN
jgi:hypothetical protein